MKKLGQSTIKRILDRAIKEFMEDESAPEFVSFLWNGHYVMVDIEWSYSKCAYYVSYFRVVYSRCVMTYSLHEDFDLDLAWCI